MGLCTVGRSGGGVSHELLVVETLSTALGQTWPGRAMRTRPGILWIWWRLKSEAIRV